MVFAEMLKEDEAPKALVKKLGLEQVSDEGAILKLVEETIAENPQSVADYKAGKDKAIGFLVGPGLCKKISRQKANPGHGYPKCSKKKCNKARLSIKHHLLR